MNPTKSHIVLEQTPPDCLRLHPFVLAAIFCFSLSPALLPAQGMELLVSPGKLSQVHAELSGINNCSACHTEKKKVDPGKCLACHKDLAVRIQAGRGYHQNKKANCLPCHPEHEGEKFNLVDWDPKKFSHAETGYPLAGLHRKISDCAACHATANALKRKKSKTYLLKGTACEDCHADVHRGQLGTSCSRCHTVEVPFKQAVFDHGKSRFPLQGAHGKVKCASCHVNKQWKGLAFSRCSDCHRDPHRPPFQQNCRSCHDENSWKSMKFNHGQTRYPLEGKHRALTCVQCHPRGEKGRGIAFANCSDCHRKDPHRGQLGNNCQSCHVVEGFDKVSFDHGKTRYPLTGKHASVSCQKCHPKKGPDQFAVYKPLLMGCSDCHADVHLQQFARKCDACHTTQGFTGAALKFNHQADSAYPLLGKHAAAACQKCHVKTKMAFPAGKGEAVLYKPLASACSSCHVDVHQGQLGKECQKCHGVDSFKPAPGFDHDRSRFSLRLFHEKTACKDCHPSTSLVSGGKTVQAVQYKNISLDCLGCHRKFQHRRNSFAFTGVHGGLDCGQCHNARTPNLRKSGTGAKDETECTLCHRSPHLGLQKNCQACHSGKNWRVQPW